MGFDFTWAFVLGEDTGGGTTRLHVRERYRTSSHKVRLTTQVTSVVSAVMSARMMRTIRRLAEETSPEPGPAA